MLIENDFTVEAAPDDVFGLMVDVERVAPCLPGTEILGARQDGGYDGQMSIKLGPMKMKYKGTVAIDEQDRAARTAVMIAKGVEAKGQGTAQGTMTMTVREDPAGARVHVSTDIKITGRVAQMGQGIMKDVSTKMVGEMARNMEQALGGGSTGAPPSVGAAVTPLAPEPADGLVSVAADADRGSGHGATGPAPTTPSAAAAARTATDAPARRAVTGAGSPSAPAKGADVKLMTIIHAVVIGRLQALRNLWRGRRGS